MKKVIVLVLAGLVIASPAFCELASTRAESNLASKVIELKDTVKSQAQRIETLQNEIVDIVTSNTSILTSDDKTKLSELDVLVTETVISLNAVKDGITDKWATLE